MVVPRIAARSALAWSLVLVSTVVTVVFSRPSAGFAAQAPPAPCVESAPNAKAAHAAAKACGGRVEILSERSETTQVFANADGSRTLEESIEPVRVRHGSQWVPIDTTLHKVKGGIAPRAAALPLVFSAGGKGPLARLSSGGRELAMSWPGGLPEPVLDGDTAVYRDVLPGVDLRVTALSLGFSEVLIVRSVEAAANPRLAAVRFGLTAKGVTVANAAGGGLVARDGKGRVVFSAPAPLMWDSSVGDGSAPSLTAEKAAGPVAKPATASAAGPAAVGSKAGNGSRRSVMAVRVGAGELTVVPDRALLTDPNVRFPVYIDPSWTGSVSGGAWTSVWSKYPSSSFWQNSTALLNGSVKGSAGAGRVEDCSGCGDYIIRSFFRMDTSRVRGLHILSATFRVEQRWSWTCVPASNAKLWLTGPISSGTTWNAQPSWNGGYTAQTLGNRKYGASSGCLGPGTIEFNASAMVSLAAASNWSTMTVGLRAVDEGTKYQWKRFNHTSPKLAVTYNTLPDAPADRASDGRLCDAGGTPTYVYGETPTLKAKQSDPDTDQQSLTTWFYWWAVGGSRNETDKVSVSAGNPADVTKAIPAGKLADGGSYIWQAKTTDGTDTGAWSGECRIVVDSTPPPTPGPVSSTDYPATGTAGGPGVEGAFTVPAPSLRPQEVTGYAYTLDSAVVTGAAQVPADPTTHNGVVHATPTHDGVNLLRVWAVDAAGRFSATAATYTFTVQAVAGSGAAAEWIFDEASGAATDMTTHANTATLSGSGATRVSGRGGVGSALSVDGVAGYAATSGPVQLPNPSTGVMMPVRTDNTFTATARVRLTATGGSGVYAAVSADGSNTSAYVLGYSGPDNRWVFRMAGSDVSAPTWASVLSDAAPIAGTWTHLAGTYDAGTHVLRLYVNGVLQTGSATLSGGFNATGPVAVGRAKVAGANAGFFGGALDDVRVYNFLESAANLAVLAQPLGPTVTFPNGTQATTGGQLTMVFDGGGDANVTSFKYSVDSTALDQTAVPGPPGGTAQVSVPAGSVTGAHVIYVVGNDGVRSGPITQGLYTVIAAVSLRGTVYDEFFTPLPGAVLTLAPVGLTTTADEFGMYVFSGFAAGDYVLSGTYGDTCPLVGSAPVTVDSPDVVFDLTLYAGTDGLGYTCTTQAATFVTADTTVLALTGDDAVTTVGLPFAFPFYGQVYGTAWVDTNGVMSFADPGGSHPYLGGSLPATAAPNLMVAPFWDDLVVDASASVRTTLTGSGPAARFTLEWRNVYRKASSSQRLSFETVLAPDGTVTFNYTGLDTAAERGDNAAVGIEAPEGDDGLAFSVGDPILDNGQAIVFDNPLDPPAKFNLSGVLTDNLGAPIVGATVTLDPSGRSTTTTTGGAYSFSDLVTDSYTVTSTTAGRCALVAQAQVDLAVDAVVNLQRGPDYRGMGYACSEGTSGYIAAGTVLALTGDDATKQVTLPFTFRFHGRTYTTALVDTNGLLSFGGSAGVNTWANAAIPNSQAPNAVVAPFWDDLNIDGPASVRTQLTGSAPNRVYTVEWRNAKLVAAPSYRVTVEAMLYEDGRIAFQYGSGTNSSQLGAGATIGLENYSGTLAKQYSLWEASLTPNSSITYTPGPVGTISGQLTAAITGTAIAGATITLTPGGTTATTGSDGSYQFTSLPVGEYTVSASMTGVQCPGQYAKQTVNIAGGTSDVDPSLMTAGDEFGYSCQTGTETFTPGDVVEAWSGDETVWQKNPPFPISLYGTTYTSAWISANGLITFKDPSFFGWIGSAPSTLPSPAAEGVPNAAVYAIWDDWVVDAQARIATKLSGTAPNRQWIVEWRNVVAYDDPNQRLSAEVIFDENGTIHLAYSGIDTANPLERGAGATVGIEDASGTVAYQYLYKETWLSSGQGVRYTPTPPPVGSVSGTITCQGAAVSGATVAVGGHSATTNAAGVFTVTSVPGGAYSAIGTIPSGSCKGSSAQPVTVTANTAPITFAATTTPAWSGYTLTEQATAFVRADTTVLSLTGDDAYTQISLPFSVTLYGNSYTTGWVDTDGVLSFIDPGEPSPDAWPIPSAASPQEPNAAVYPFWHDWVVDSSASVRTTVTGTAPTRTFIVEWRNVYSYEDPNTRVSFEVVFNESGGFTFAYTDQEGTFIELGGAATIGIENAAGTAALQYTYRHPALRPGVGLVFTAPTS